MEIRTPEWEHFEWTFVEKPLLKQDETTACPGLWFEDISPVPLQLPPESMA